MLEWFSKFLLAFIPLFVAIDPIGLAAIFLGLGQNVDRVQRQKIASQATWTGGLVALGFLFLGQSMFTAVGISVSDFQIAGGLILFILAARDLIQSAAEPEKLPPDFGVVPLGMPLIAGPASITTLLVLAQNQAVGPPPGRDAGGPGGQPRAGGAGPALQRMARPQDRRHRPARHLQDCLDAPRGHRGQHDQARPQELGFLTTDFTDEHG
jgi:hypothetical protein